MLLDHFEFMDRPPELSAERVTRAAGESWLQSQLTMSGDVKLLFILGGSKRTRSSGFDPEPDVSEPIIHTKQVLDCLFFLYMCINRFNMRERAIGSPSTNFG